MKIVILSVLFAFFLLFAPAAIEAQQQPKPTPTSIPAKNEPTIDLGKTANSSSPVQIAVMLTLLSFIPALLISMTCFTRLIVVFHFLRQALGTQEAPNNQILLGLSLFITLFVMGPTFTQIYNEALKPMDE